jgi:hypothetical protein
MNSKRLLESALALGVTAIPAAGHAAQLAVSLEVPRLSVAEYHRPYVAIWIERPDQTAVKTLAVWWEVNGRNNEGAKYLGELRQWWRKSGRSLDLKADGLSGPTRAPGKYQLTFSGAQLADLAPGAYNLVVEASREVGGREVIRAPFAWPPKAGRPAAIKGASELGAVTVTARP